MRLNQELHEGGQMAASSQIWNSFLAAINFSCEGRLGFENTGAPLITMLCITFYCDDLK